MTELLQLLKINNLNDLADSSTKKPVQSYDILASKLPHLSGVINKNLFAAFDKNDYSVSELSLNFFTQKPVKETDEKITITVSDKEKDSRSVVFTFDCSSMKLTFDSSNSFSDGTSQTENFSNQKKSISVTENTLKPVSLRFIFDNDSFIVFINNGESTFSDSYKLQKKARRIKINTTITRGLQFKIINLSKAF